MHTKRFSVLHFESKGFKKLTLFPNEKVTPELAKDLLTLNTDNRPIKDTTVKRYTEDMKAGEWAFTGESIGISNEGKLLNGQHRLLAIINSGTTQVFHLQSGLEPKTFNKMDIGKLRSAGDTLAMQGFTNYGIVATIVRYVTMYNAGMLADYITGNNKTKFSNQELADYATGLNRDLLQNSATAASKYYARMKFMDTTTFGPLMYIFHKINSEDMYNFFDMLASGDGIGVDNYSPIYVLRNKLLNSTMSGSKITPRHKFAVIIKAWNAFRQHKTVKILAYSDTDEFPKPI